jgi:hypothetical protein
MELTINIARDEERFTRDEFALYLAKRDFMKRLIEIEMAERLAAESRLTEDDAEDLADMVKKSMYARMKSA